MRYAKYLGAAGLAALAVGTVITAVGAFEPSIRLVAIGATCAFAGLTATATGSLLAQRQQLHSLDRIRRVLGPNAASGGELEQVIRAEVSDVARIVDARILGLFETLHGD